jgi:hypothetical protein
MTIAETRKQIESCTTVEQLAQWLWKEYRATLTLIPVDHGPGKTDTPAYMAEVTRSFWYSPSGNIETESSLFWPTMIAAAREAACLFFVRRQRPDELMTVDEALRDPQSFVDGMTEVATVSTAEQRLREQILAAAEKLRREKEST